MCVEYPIVSTCMLYYVCDRRVDSNGLASQAKQPSEARISKSTSFHKMVVLGSFAFLIMNTSLCQEDTCLVTFGGVHKLRWQVCVFFFDPLPPYVDIFYLINVDKNKTFLDYLPTSPCKCSLWTTSCLVCLWHSKVGCICWHLWRGSTSDINRCIRLKSMKYH